MDYGCPQLTDPTLLKNYIIEGGFNYEFLKDLKKLRQLTSQATSPYFLHYSRIVYRNNEIFVDVIESVNTLFSAQGILLKLDVSGIVKINARLGGMP